jgi:hypothetical protein
MSRADAFVLAIVVLALFGSRAMAREWPTGRFLARRWQFVRPYASSYIRSSPATFIYAGIIAFTTWVLAGSSGRLTNAVLRSQSTNLSNLRHHAVDVLFRSAFWSGYAYILPIAALLAIVLAPAEFWLGTGRTILVFAIGHIGATLITAIGIDLAVHFGQASRGIENSIDVGVSYGTVCVAGVLTYRLSAPWRYLWLFGILGTLVFVAAVDGSFSDYGHVVSVLLGVVCYPITQAPGAIQRRNVPMYRPWLSSGPQ